MTEEELDAMDELIPALAVAALKAAHQRARALGIVLVVDDAKLIELFPDVRRVFIKDVAPRVKVTSRIKHATS